jgi:hypothetical protein
VSSHRQQELAELHRLTEQQAEELAQLRLKANLEHALDLLFRPSAVSVATSLETLRLSKLSPADLAAEIKVLTDEVAAYTADGVYAPERHAELYRRANVLFSIKGLGDAQNNWLQRAVRELDELAVRHAEEALDKGDTVALVDTVMGIGDWSFRLTRKQRERLVAAVEASATANGLPKIVHHGENRVSKESSSR